MEPEPRGLLAPPRSVGLPEYGFLSGAGLLAFGLVVATADLRVPWPVGSVAVPVALVLMCASGLGLSKSSTRTFAACAAAVVPAAFLFGWVLVVSMSLLGVPSERQIGAVVLPLGVGGVASLLVVGAFAASRHYLAPMVPEPPADQPGNSPDQSRTDRGSDERGTPITPRATRLSAPSPTPR